MWEKIWAAERVYGVYAFEDAVQSATAERIHADYLITRTMRNFAKSKVVAFTPAELFARIGWKNKKGRGVVNYTPAFSDGEISSKKMVAARETYRIYG